MTTVAGGGSGGGNGAAGGQGSFQDYVGPPPDYGSLYEPKEYGGRGGSGGGSVSDLRCTYSVKNKGGKGGMELLLYFLYCSCYCLLCLCLNK